MESQQPSGRVSDSKLRGPGFKPHRSGIVSLSKTLIKHLCIDYCPGSAGCDFDMTDFFSFSFPHRSGLGFITLCLNQFQPSASVKNGLLLKLNMLSWLFASLDTERDSGETEEPKVKAMASGPKPVFVILQQIAPMLRTIVSNWIMDAGVVEVII